MFIRDKRGTFATCSRSMAFSQSGLSIRNETIINQSSKIKMSPFNLNALPLTLSAQFQTFERLWTYKQMLWVLCPSFFFYVSLLYFTWTAVWSQCFHHQCWNVKQHDYAINWADCASDNVYFIVARVNIFLHVQYSQSFFLLPYFLTWNML